MALLLKNTTVGRRAYAISKHDATQLVFNGKAMQDPLHADIYEEITEGERKQGYMTRNMLPIVESAASRKRAAVRTKVAPMGPETPAGDTEGTPEVPASGA